MKFFIGLMFGFFAGMAYALYQTVEAPDGLVVKLMSGFKSILEVL